MACENTALQIADYFLAAAPVDKPLSQLKLQKLCAYAQAAALAYLGEPLFDEPLLAYKKGPVIKSILDRYPGKDQALITDRPSREVAFTRISGRKRFVTYVVNKVYSDYTDDEISAQSHVDFPGDFGSQAVISNDLIRARFLASALVQDLQASDKPIPEHHDHTLINADEFIRGLAG